ncbi:ABC transporter ATP-binding protein [Clostridia bacterium]|nr:ABC transporter ATP-binding protein [Clostridia bacterium]
MSLIEMHSIGKTYGKGSSAVRALEQAELTVEDGDFLAILGPSGSGKSTLMNIIGLMDTADSGEYMLDGVDIRSAKERDYAKLRSRKIGFIFQKYNLIPKYSVTYNVQLPLLLSGKSYSYSKKKALETLQRVGLSDKARKKPSELSGGQAQRVAVARALVTECPLILADEPTGALDKKTGAEVLEFMEELNSGGKTIIMITHDQAIAKRARRIVYIEDGKTIENRAGELS